MFHCENPVSMNITISNEAYMPHGVTDSTDTFTKLRATSQAYFQPPFPLSSH